MTFDPVLLLSMWAAGLAACAALVAWWKVSRTGYLWLAAAVVVLVGLAAGLADGVAAVGIGLAVLGGLAAKRPPLAGAAFAASAVAFLVVGLERDSLLPVLAGSAALGGITAEMLLGHWYLVDPKLPRWALRRLDVIGGLGVVAEIAVAVASGSLRSPATLLGLAYLMLAALTLLLTVGVWYSLKEKGYEGVMAATGLSYLATLTVLGTTFLART
ncbi:MAG TPA: hypothetical protein VMS74_05060 [Acidimicrobiia bacterium]|nr:hypothetical protein [Acidimicrobiia bacterium]